MSEASITVTETPVASTEKEAYPIAEMKEAVEGDAPASKAEPEEAPKKAEPEAEASKEAATGEGSVATTEDAKADDDAEAAAPPPAPKAAPVMDILAMLTMATSISTSVKEDNTTQELGEKVKRQRRRSRELEVGALNGLELADIDHLRKKFNEIDVDGSGSISMEELRGALEKVGKRPNEKQMKTMIEKFDDNGDGVLQFDEFTNMVRDWDTILGEADDAEARQKAAMEAAAQKPLEFSNAMTAEEKERRKSLASEFGIEEPLQQGKPRRKSKELPGLEGAGTPGGGGAAAARALGSSPDVKERRKSRSGEIPILTPPPATEAPPTTTAA